MRSAAIFCFEAYSSICNLGESHCCCIWVVASGVSHAHILACFHAALSPAVRSHGLLRLAPVCISIAVRLQVVGCTLVLSLSCLDACWCMQWLGGQVMEITSLPGLCTWSLLPPWTDGAPREVSFGSDTFVGKPLIYVRRAGILSMDVLLDVLGYLNVLMDFDAWGWRDTISVSADVMATPPLCCRLPPHDLFRLMLGPDGSLTGGFAWWMVDRVEWWRRMVVDCWWEVAVLGWRTACTAATEAAEAREVVGDDAAHHLLTYSPVASVASGGLGDGSVDPPHADVAAAVADADASGARTVLCGDDPRALSRPSARTTVRGEPGIGRAPVVAVTPEAGATRMTLMCGSYANPALSMVCVGVEPAVVAPPSMAIAAEQVVRPGRSSPGSAIAAPGGFSDQDATSGRHTSRYARPCLRNRGGSGRPPRVDPALAQFAQGHMAGVQLAVGHVGAPRWRVSRRVEIARSEMWRRW